MSLSTSPCSQTNPRSTSDLRALSAGHCDGMPSMPSAGTIWKVGRGGERAGRGRGGGGEGRRKRRRQRNEILTLEELFYGCKVLLHFMKDREVLLKV